MNDKYIVKLRLEGDYPAPGDFEEYVVNAETFDAVRTLLKKSEKVK